MAGAYTGSSSDLPNSLSLNIIISNELSSESVGSDGTSQEDQEIRKSGLHGKHEESIQTTLSWSRQEDADCLVDPAHFGMGLGTHQGRS